MTRVAVLWHMHQPDYRDPLQGRPTMPWARLHALRGYRDMAVALLETGAATTVNLVPSLLDQLLGYAEGGGDPHLDLTRAPAASLDPAQRAVVAGSFLAGHPAMFDAHEATRALRARRERNEPLSTQELLDLQVWSTLAWVGWSGLRDEPVLAELRRKARGFHEDDKRAMLAACERLVRGLIPLWRQLAQAGRVEISASPYYHPILPLLIDTRFARRCLPDLPARIPQFCHPGDARAQLQRGRRRVEEVLGVPVEGLWPPEGAICPEVVPLAAEAGFTWLVSDEGNLLRSERDDGPPGGPWDLGSGVVGFFRDRDLSDSIGFRWARRPAQQVVDELMAACRRHEQLAVIALDGENPWESFEDAGREHQLRLFDALARGPGTTLRDRARDREGLGGVYALHTGSWINADLAIWFGDDEDRMAWEQLARARDAVFRHGNPPEALEHVQAAEGSDWFWWYGREFATPFALEFDRLFRAHLGAAWQALGEPAPDALSAPIKQRVGTVPDLRLPTRPIRLRPEGRRPGFFEWLGAGYADVGQSGSSMALGATHLKGIAWGLDGETLSVRLDHRQPLPVEPPGTEWVLVLVGEPEVRPLRWPYEGPDAEAPGPGALCTELTLGLPAGFRGRMHVALVRAGVQVARYPADADLPVEPHASEDEGWWV